MFCYIVVFIFSVYLMVLLSVKYLFHYPAYVLLHCVFIFSVYLMVLLSVKYLFHYPAYVLLHCGVYIFSLPHGVAFS